jgi:hypothetical protein
MPDMVRPRKSALCVSAFVAITIVCSCAPYATYPPIDGAVGIDNPGYEPVPTIMADSFEYVHERYNAGHETFALNLPAGTPAKVYDKVILKMGEGEPMTDPSQWGYHLVELRSRGLSAEVDFVIPRPGAPHALVTVHLEKKFNNYSIASAKVWNLPVTVPSPNYIPPPPVEALAQSSSDAPRD